MNNFKRNTILGIIFCAVAGTLSHFLYNWSGGSTLVGVFTPVNESIWEHLKLLFYPVLIFSVYEYLSSRRETDSFIPARTLSLITGMVFTLTAYYTITGIIGRDISWVNVAIFFVSVLIVFLLTNCIIKNTKKVSKACIIWSLVAVAVFATLLTGWTFYPPNLNVFIDMQTRTRGIYGI